jgi:nicotinamide-nucleotide amidase
MAQKHYLSRLTRLLLERGWMIATAESCTAGLVSKLLTDQAGSSQWFDRGFVTYSNQSKQEMLGVQVNTLSRYGAVSRETVSEMALGALHNSTADTALAISGIAGPDGGTDEKPVGTVWFAWADDTGRVDEKIKLFAGDRDSIRQQAADYAIRGMLEFLSR